MKLQTSIGEVETYIGKCCREWVMVKGFMGGTCGLCGERPAYLREDDQ